MRTVILSLETAIETGLKDIEVLDKQDKIIFLYVKGNGNISIPVHTALAQLKNKVDFYEIQDTDASSEDMLMYYAYLAGSNPNPIIIGAKSKMDKLTFLNIPTYSDFKAAIVKKTNAVATQGKVSRGRKPKSEVKKDTFVKPVSGEKEKSAVEEESHKNEANEENPSVKPVRKRKDVCVKTANIDDLKVFLHEQATDDFNPETLTMSIYQAVSNTIIKGTLITEELNNTVIYKDSINKINNALLGKWSQVTDIVTGILREKGKI